MTLPNSLRTHPTRRLRTSFSIDSSTKAGVHSHRDTQRIFNANHDSVRASSLSQIDAQPHDAFHDLQTSIHVSNNSKINLPDVSQNQSLDMSIPVFDSGPDQCRNHESISEIPSLLDIQVAEPPTFVTKSHLLRARPTCRARIFSPIDTSTQAGVLSSLDLLIVTPTQLPHASDREYSPVHDNPASCHPLSVVREKPRVPVKITTAANRSRSPVSKGRLEESDIVIAARSFRNSFGDNFFNDNFRRSACLFCGAVTLRARRSALLTESHAQCVHSNFDAPRANSTADDRHWRLSCVHLSAPKAVPREYVRNLLREPNSNSEPRYSPRVQTFASHAPTSCTRKPVLSLFLRNSIVTRLATPRNNDEIS